MNKPKRLLPDISERRVLDLVGEIYEAAADPGQLPRLLESIALATHSETGAIFVQDVASQQGQMVSSYQFDSELLASYDKHYSKENVFMMRAEPDLVSGAVLPGNRYVRDDELRKTLYFNDYLTPLDAFQNVGCCIFREKTLTAMLTFLRRIGEPAYSDQDLGLFSVLMPHFQRSLSIQRRIQGLDSQSDTSLQVLDHLDQAVVILDHQGQPTYSNPRADEIFEARDGLTLHPNGLRATSSADDEQLHRLISGAIGTALGLGVQAGGSMVVRRPSLKRSYGILVAPLPAKILPMGESLPSVAVFLSDPERTPEIPTDLLARAYGLTPAETRVAELLLQGLDPKSCSDLLEVSIETVRTHMKRVFSKTGTRGQSDLIRLLLSGPRLAVGRS